MEIKSAIDQLGAKKLALSRTAPLPQTQDLPQLEVKAAVVHAPSQDASAVIGGPCSELDLAEMSQADALDNFEAFIAGNPQAARDLRQLQEEGKLTPEVLSNLNKLMQQPLAEGIDRANLINQALCNMADPTSITQGGRQTCAAATVEIMLAKEDPAEFLRVLSGLASPEGTVTLKNGDTIQRDANWNNNSNRSLIDNLMQPAFMQYATGGYDNVRDTRLDGAGQGMYADEQAMLTKAVTGKDVGVVFGNSPEIMDQIGKATSKGNPISAVIKGTGPDGKEYTHSVLIEGIKDGKVSFIDPNGKRMTVPASEFQKLIDSVNLPADMITPQQQRDMAVHNRGPLAGCGGVVGQAVNGLVDAVKDVGKAINNVVCDTIKQVTKMTMTVIATGLDLVGAKGLANKARELEKDLDKAIERTRELVEYSLEVTAKLTKGAIQVMMNPTDLSGAVAYFKSAIKEVGKLLVKAMATLEAFPGMREVFKFLASDAGKKLMLIVSLILTVCTFGAAAPLAALIGPAVISAANLAMAGIAVYNGVKGLAMGMATGNLKMAAQGVVSAVMGYYGAKAPAAGSWGAKTLTGVKTVMAVDGAVEAYKKGDVTGAVMGLGAAYMASGGSGSTEIAGGVTVGQALNTAKAIHDKDYGAAVGSIAGAAGASAKTAQNLATAANVIQAVDEGNYMAAVAGVGGAMGGTAGASLQVAAMTADAIEHHRYGEVMGAVAWAAGATGASQGTVQNLTVAAGLIDDVASGDYLSALGELGHGLGGTVGDSLYMAADTAKAIEDKDYAKLMATAADMTDSTTLANTAALMGQGDYGQIARNMLSAAGISEDTVKNVGMAAAAAYVLSSDDKAGTLNKIGQKVGGEAGQDFKMAAGFVGSLESGNYVNALGYAAAGTENRDLAMLAKGLHGAETGNYTQAAELLSMAAGASSDTTSMLSALAGGDYTTALGDLGDLLGGSIGNGLTTAANTAKAIEDKNYAQAMGFVAGATESETLANAAFAVSAAQNGDTGAAAMGLARAFGASEETATDLGTGGKGVAQNMLNATGMSQETLQNVGIAAGVAYVASSDKPSETLDSLGRRVGGTSGERMSSVAGAVDAIENKEYAQAMGYVAGLTENQTLANAAATVGWAQNGNSVAAAQTLGQMVGGTIGNNLTTAGNLAEAIDEKNVVQGVGIVAGATNSQTLAGVAWAAEGAQNQDLGAVARALAEAGNASPETMQNVASVVQGAQNTSAAARKTTATAGQLASSVKNNNTDKAKTEADQMLADIKDLLTPMDAPVIL